jgi:hypothetical protein
MITDQELTLSDAQAVTAAAASTNVIDLGPLDAGNTTRDIGIGEEMWLVLTCTTAMTDAGSDSTLAVTMETDNNEAFSSPTTIWTAYTFAAVSPAGRQTKLPLPPANYERYIRLKYTPSGGDLTTGSFKAQIVRDVPARHYYAGTHQSSAE